MVQNNNDAVADVLRRYASFLGATGVAAGAFGAHALKDVLNNKGAMENWRTAVMYQLFHATALLGVSALAGEKVKDKANPNFATGGNLLAFGTVLFSGSIYCLCLGAGPKRILGPTTPIGGLMMIAGWAMLGM